MSGVDRERFLLPSDRVGPNSPLFYPDSDDEPMADNTRQWRLIVLLVNGLRCLHEHDPQVFVAGNLFWYPVEGDSTTRQAPDALVAFGRPRGDRYSYLQWVEGGIAPQVVFEVLSPGNRPAEMLAKRHFYERYGVEEYYVLDPDTASMEGWRRVSGRFQPVPDMTTWTSPRLGIRFEADPLDVEYPLRFIRPDGKYFESSQQVHARLHLSEAKAKAAEHEVERLRERLRKLGIDPDSVE